MHQAHLLNVKQTFFTCEKYCNFGIIHVRNLIAWGASVMLQKTNMYKLAVLGPFRIKDRDGLRIEVRSKRGQALLTMLATAKSAERSRTWLQDKLWGSRSAEQANASLRKELSNLRKLLNINQNIVLDADNGRVWLNLDLIDIDIRSPLNLSNEELLEGMDIAGEEAFEEWLREERNFIAAQQEAYPIAPQVPAIDLKEFSQKPAIAVLPFKSDADRDLQQNAYGLSEDLIDRLARLKWLPVIARSSSFSLTEDNIETQAKKLGASYIVEGSLRRSQDKQILLAMLNETHSGRSIWSTKMELPLEPKSDAIEPLITAISSALGTQVDIQEQNRAIRKPQSDLNVNGLIWRGRWHLNQLTREGFDEAERCFTKALEREPHSPEALIQFAWVALWNHWYNRGSKENIRTIRKLAQKAIIANYDDARGHMLAGIAESWLHQPLRSQALLERALELNPSLALAYAQLGSTLCLSGKPKEAIEKLHVAKRLSPNDQHLFFFLGEFAMAHLLLNENDMAIKAADESIMRRPAYWYSYIIKINACARMDRMLDAQMTAKELQNQFPEFESHFIDWIPFIDSNWNDLLKRGLNLSRI